MSILRLIRYRFFLFAGMLPYLLGQAVAFGLHKSLRWNLSLWGFAGIFLVLVAVELFNEYFDAKTGGDRIFSPGDITIPAYFFPLGLLAVALAFIVGVYLTLQTGWPILLFSFLGFLGAYFYVGPPIRWAYRGFGELTIGFCYGPFMVLGSYYLQTRTIEFATFFVSVIGGLSIFCLSVLNEIPDYYQDMLVGKRNLVVRLGRQRAVRLLESCLAGVFLLLVLGVVLGVVPLFAIAAVVTLPWIWKSMTRIHRDYDNPKVFLFAVNTIVITHVVVVSALGISFLAG